jgi:uncharacterized protein
MEIIADPQQIAVLAKAKEQSIVTFFKFLKQNFKSKEIDSAVHVLNEKVSAAIDCTRCGNCCKNMNAAMGQSEMERLAACVSKTPQEFSKNYCLHDEIENAFFIKSLPCVFLMDNKCTVYEQRPASCAEFPHLNRPNFIFRTKTTLDNYAYCPIVYNVVENLKEHYQFKE